MFTWWNHWPVAQVDSSGRPAVAADRASSSSLSHIYWDAYQTSDRTETKLLMDGLTSLPSQQLVPLAKSWLSPPSIHVTDRNASSADFDPSQRAFVIHRDQSAKAERLVLALDPSADSLLVNPRVRCRELERPSEGHRCQQRVGIRCSCPHRVCSAPGWRLHDTFPACSFTQARSNQDRSCCEVAFPGREVEQRLSAGRDLSCRDRGSADRLARPASSRHTACFRDRLDGGGTLCLESACEYG
jgi:hypothetical protein